MHEKEEKIICKKDNQYNMYRVIGVIFYAEAKFGG